MGGIYLLVVGWVALKSHLGASGPHTQTTSLEEGRGGSYLIHQRLHVGLDEQQGAGLHVGGHHICRGVNVKKAWPVGGQTGQRQGRWIAVACLSPFV